MSNLTVKGEQILSEIISIHHRDYVENNPGCNGNDVERDLLHDILNKYCTSGSSVVYNRLSNWIETIR